MTGSEQECDSPNEHDEPGNRRDHRGPQFIPVIDEDEQAVGRNQIPEAICVAYVVRDERALGNSSSTTIAHAIGTLVVVAWWQQQSLHKRDEVDNSSRSELCSSSLHQSLRCAR